MLLKRANIVEKSNRWKISTKNKVTVKKEAKMRSMNLKRVKSLSMSCLVTLLMCSLLLIAPFDRALAQSVDEHTAKLIEGAKKEGEMLWYTSISWDHADRLTKGFGKKYPFIKARLYRSAGARLLTKILAEARAKSYLVDATMNSGINAVLQQKAGIFAKYLSPHREFYIDKDPEGYWTDAYVNYSIIGYNTKLVSPQEVPKTYEDLLDPKWKGKIGMDSEPYDWFYTFMKIMGKEKGLKYMKKLSEQKPLFSRGNTLISQLLAAGETSVAITIYNYSVEEMKTIGAPVEWVGEGIPVNSLIHPIGVCARAPHPNAARLFVDFILSVEGQEMMASFHRIPSRIDVLPLTPKLKKGLNIVPWDASIVDNYEENQKLFREIFLKKR